VQNESGQHESVKRNPRDKNSDESPPRRLFETAGLCKWARRADPGAEEVLSRHFPVPVQGDRGSLSSDPEPARRLKYNCCGCASWRWTYGSAQVPSLQALIAVADDFDPVFENEPPIPRPAQLLIKNTPRSRLDMPKVCATMLIHPVIGLFFKTSPFKPIEKAVIPWFRAASTSSFTTPRPSQGRPHNHIRRRHSDWHPVVISSSFNLILQNAASVRKAEGRRHNILGMMHHSDWQQVCNIKQLQLQLHPSEHFASSQCRRHN
jgi:hypothetical protein